MNKAIVSAAGLILAGMLPAQAQTKPKSPAEIAEASKKMAEINSACRDEANAQKLHLVKRQTFLRACRKEKQKQP
jgi:hypothetical protein